MTGNDYPCRMTFLAFAAFTLFVVHEFEEIIRCRPWIERHESEARYARDMWIRNRRAYPSTETIAAMILEEVILAAIILLIASSSGYLSLVFAVVFGNSLHLVGHIISAMASKAWNPGSITAAMTLPFNIAILIIVWMHTIARVRFGALQIFTASIIITAVLVANLSMLHHISPRLDAMIHRG